MFRFSGGYFSTSAQTMLIMGYTLLWTNYEIGLYIFKQPVTSAGVLENITMKNLINPQPYLKEEYSNVTQL
jgi:hypothetical protein